MDAPIATTRPGLSLPPRRPADCPRAGCDPDGRDKRLTWLLGPAWSQAARGQACPQALAGEALRLIEQGAWPGRPERGSIAPGLVTAARWRREGLGAVFGALVARATPAELDTRDAWSMGALHACAHAGDLEGVEALLAAGAEANPRDERGWTPLMMAAERGHSDCVCALLRAGADHAARSADGESAESLANAHREEAREEGLSRGDAAEALHAVGEAIALRACLGLDRGEGAPAGPARTGRPRL